MHIHSLYLQAFTDRAMASVTAPHFEPLPSSGAATETLASWLAEEAALRLRLEGGPGHGVARPDQVAGCSGLEVLERMLRG